MKNGKLAYVQMAGGFAGAERRACRAGLQETAGILAGLRSEFMGMKAAPDRLQVAELLGRVGGVRMMLTVESMFAKGMIEAIPEECRSCRKAPFLIKANGGGMSLLMGNASAILSAKREVLGHAATMTAGGSLLFAAMGAVTTHKVLGAALTGLMGLVLVGKAAVQWLGRRGLFDLHEVASFEKKLEWTCGSIERSMDDAEKKLTAHLKAVMN